jgi:CubicO group peptidase (beta-lactamase class C family)
MRHQLLYFLILLTISCTAQKVAPEAQVSAVEVVENVKTAALVEAYLEEKIAQGVIPGGTFYLSHKGEVLVDDAFGKKDVEGKVDFKRNDIFRIASMTKALTSVAILQLIEQGKLSLDDPISKYIPDFKNMEVLDVYDEETATFSTVPSKKQVTIRHLLTHTSGIYYGLFENEKYRNVYTKYGIDQFGIYVPDLTTIDMARMIAKAPLKHEPGTQWTYGLNMDVLGAVVEIITKRKLSLIFLTEIFYPLGMHNSHFYLPEAKYNMLAPLFTINEEGQLLHSQDEIANFPIFLNKGHYAGGGGVSSTAIDYGKFLEALHNKGEYNGKRILKESTIDLMLTEQLGEMNIDLGEGPGVGFCLGHRLVTETQEGPVPFGEGTYSWGGYFNSKWWVDPTNDLVFVGMTNVLPFPHQDFWPGLYEVIYKSIEN